MSKAFREAARAAQATLRHADLCKWAVDDAVMGAVVSKCSQLSSLNLEGCGKITDAAVLAVASGCKQLSSLDLGRCGNITDAAVVAVASGCKQLATLYVTLESVCLSVAPASMIAASTQCRCTRVVWHRRRGL